MDTWSPLFSKIVDSSLWAEPDYVVKVFITLLSKKDADQVSRMTAYAIGTKCWPGDPEAEVRAISALKVLSEPDRRRVEPQPYEGRRISKVEEGWLILNGQWYEDMMRRINRRQYKRDKQAEYRQKQKMTTPSATTAREREAVKHYNNGDVQAAEKLAEPATKSVSQILKEKRAQAG